jgi:hypothetical protein
MSTTPTPIAAAKKSPFVSVVDFVASCGTAVEYELEPFIMSRSFTIVSGPPKQGKTFFVSWIASELSAQGKAIMFVEEEGPAEILRDRFAPFIGHEWERHRDTLLISHRKGFRLDDPRKVDSLIAHAKAAGAAVIIIDPSDKVHSRDENKSTGSDGISELVQEIQRIIRETGAAVVLIHHNRKSKAPREDGEEALSSDLRGSIAWTAGADSVIQVHGIPKAERRPGELRFYVENSDSRVVPFDRRVAVVRMSGGEGAITFLDPNGPGALRESLHRLLPHVPEAPDCLPQADVISASGMGSDRGRSAIKYGLGTGAIVRVPGKGGGLQRRNGGLVRESPRQSTSSRTADSPLYRESARDAGENDAA